MEDQSIRVLIVEDSKSTGRALAHLLQSFEVVGIAGTGKEALRLFARHKPDVITMDIHLPDTDGLALTKQILKSRKVPIIVISSMVSPEKQGLVFEALRAGAYDVVAKSRFFDTQGRARPRQKLRRLIRAAVHEQHQTAARATYRKPLAAQSSEPSSREAPNILAIGASTGGPAVLSDLLSALDVNIKVPILVAQHMAEGFVEGFARWLDSVTPLSVQIAENNCRPQATRVYLPPSGHHMSVTAQGNLSITKADGLGPKPSVDQLFSSVARSHGARAMCLLLTGMGRDGAEGLLAAKQKMALTAVQDEESSVIFGMPKAALEIGAARLSFSKNAMIAWIRKNTS